MKQNKSNRSNTRNLRNKAMNHSYNLGRVIGSLLAAKIKPHSSRTTLLELFLKIFCHETQKNNRISMVRLIGNIKLLFPTQILSNSSTSASRRHLESASSSRGLSFSSTYSNMFSNHCSRTHHTPGLTNNTSLEMRPSVHPKMRIPTIRVVLSTFLLAALASGAPTPSKIGHIYECIKKPWEC